MVWGDSEGGAGAVGELKADLRRMETATYYTTGQFIARYAGEKASV